MLSWHQEEPLEFIWSRSDCLLLVSFISVKACASHKTPQRTHTATHAHLALLCCLAHRGYKRITQKKKKNLSFVCCGVDWSQETVIILLLLLLFCSFFLFINLRFFLMPFVVFAAPFSSPEFYFHLPAHYNFPALHCVISLLSCNASWNTTGYGVWSWWWGKQILHHHMELLLLCRPFLLALLQTLV